MDTMSAKEFRDLNKTGKQNKYRNKIIAAHGKTFDSKKESERYSLLLMLSEKGVIHHLDCQVRYNLIVNGEIICAYVADFTYLQDDQRVVEDVKSEYTRKLPVYRIKKKLMKAIYNIEIKEV